MGSKSEKALNTVRVPDPFLSPFLKAQEYVSRYFQNKVENPEHATIDISGERYILIRAASMSKEFFDLVTSLYQDRGEKEARNAASSFLFDIAHAIGKADARSFHTKMGVSDPIEKLSAGPIHFAYSGWAFVEIFPESKPSPDENYYLIYDHPFSFEAEEWLKGDEKTEFPVCIMNAGYSSGWCEESFGIRLVAVEIECRAKGDEHCRFIMAPPSKIEQHLAGYSAQSYMKPKPSRTFSVPEFFQRKRLEDELRESEEFSSSLLSNSPYPIKVIDPDTSIRYVNPALEQLTGFSTSELVGRKAPYPWWTEETLQKTGRDLKEAMRKGAHKLEEVFKKKDGERFWVEITSTPVTIDGELKYYLANWVDITERKRTDEELIKHRYRLEEIVEERTAELKRTNESLEREITKRQKVEERLRLQTQKALDTSRLKSEFLANMSHEIRTPLNAIMGFGQLLYDDIENRLSDEQREFLGHVLSSGENLLKIINDILDLSKIEAGKTTLENIECSLKEIINELHKMFKQKADEKNIDIRTNFGEGISEKILSDPIRLRQILLNLIGNAVKFTDKGYVEIGVQKGKNFPERLEFYVRDTGIGIPQEKVESIFNPFEQVDGSMTRRYGGTGLGLAIVNRLIGLMGGEINVISKLGKGSTFHFCIPYKLAQGTVEQPIKIEETDDKQVSGEFRKCILVAEDNDVNYRLIEAILTKKGFRTVRAENGEDAISIYKTKRDEIDLILMDVYMPVLDGVEATRVIREQYNDGIPIIALTAYAMKGDRGRFLEAGCTDYISKPLIPSELFEKIEQCIRRSL